MIDAMGGIELPIEEDLVNDDPGHEKFVVKAGQPLYNGIEALNYVRFREDAGGDMSRTGRHQTFINAILDKASEIRQWSKLPDLIDTMGDNFSTDMAPESMVGLAKSMVAADSRTIYSHTLKGEDRRENGAWYYFADEEDVEKAKGWIEAWLNEATPKAMLPLPDRYAARTPAASLSASEPDRP